MVIKNRKTSFFAGGLIHLVCISFFVWLLGLSTLVHFCSYAGAIFADACLKGLNGVPDVVECSFVQSTVTDLPFFASKVMISSSNLSGAWVPICYRTHLSCQYSILHLYRGIFIFHLSTLFSTVRIIR